MRTTRKQLLSVIELLAGVTGLPLELDDRGPSYTYRYAVSTNGGAVFPFGETYWHAGELWDAVVFAHRAAQAAVDTGRARPARTDLPVMEQVAVVGELGYGGMLIDYDDDKPLFARTSDKKQS